MLRFAGRYLLALTLLVSGGLAMPTQSEAQVGISISFGPPLLPVYAQPLLPGPGYIWTPGYWAWNGDGYYWVPGTWVLAPQVGFFWTPPYWGWFGGFYVFHPGYWGPHIGFYGGINYGFGYFGNGYVGGRWNNGQFYYNRTVNNVNITNIHNVYNENITNVNVNHVSYNGGQGGITARPTAQEQSYAKETHLPPVSAQVQHEQTARGNPELQASMNHGKPPIAATAKPGEFKGQGAVPAQKAGGTYKPPANAQMGANKAAGGMQSNNSKIVHPNDMPPLVHATPPNTGNAQKDQQYKQQQEQLMQKHTQERQQLQKQQEQEHQKQAQQHASDQQRQQLEQKHQQQTQQMMQRQQQERQNMQKQQQPPQQKPK